MRAYQILENTSADRPIVNSADVRLLPARLLLLCLSVPSWMLFLPLSCEQCTLVLGLNIIPCTARAFARQPEHKDTCLRASRVFDLPEGLQGHRVPALSHVFIQWNILDWFLHSIEEIGISAMSFRRSLAEVASQDPDD